MVGAVDSLLIIEVVGKGTAAVEKDYRAGVGLAKPAVVLCSGSGG